MKRIGPYEVLDELGRGGMGAVYRARHPEAPREVAVKVLLAPLADAEERARFEREALALGRLRHPGIIPVHDAGLGADGNPYLVLGLMPGGSLQERLEREGPLEPRRAAEIARDLALAVAAAHRAGVLHRDLKPHNVLFTEEGAPVLTDFGLARLTKRDERLTETGEVLGTPAYMAPEQANGQLDQIGAATDVYGLGATLYALLSGRPPFRGASLFAVLSRVLSEAPDPLPDDVDPGLAAVCLRCLEKDPGARYPGAEQLAQALEAWRTGAAAPPGGGRGWLVAVGLAGLVGVVGLAWAAGQRAAVPAPAETASTSTARPPPTPLEAYAAARDANDWARALEHADAAVAQEENARTLHALATALRHTGWEAAGLRQLDRAWRRDPSVLDPEDRLALVKHLSTELRCVDALAVIEAALRAEPTRYALRRSRAELRWQLTERAEATVELRLLAEELPPTHRLRREVEHRLAFFERERRAIATRNRPDRAVARLAREAEQLLDEGRRSRDSMHASRQLVRALMALRRAAAIRASSQVLWLIGCCRLEQNDAAEARASGIEALRYAPGKPEAAEAALLIAKSYTLERRTREAERYVNRALDLGPRLAPPDVLGFRATLLLERGHYEEARRDAERALKQAPGEPFARVVSGWLRWLRGDLKGALDEFALVKGPPGSGQMTAAREGRAVIACQLGKGPAAERELAAFLKQYPNAHRGWFTRAELRWARGEQGPALADLQRGLDELPKDHADRRARLLQRARWRAERSR